MKGKGKCKVEKVEDGPSTSAVANAAQPKKRADMNTLPTRQYLDQTLAPILLKGLQTVSRERPADPIGYLADFLNKHRRTEEPVAETV
ncbi:protein dpy-30 homolog [Teleopsis dalmanni]|uniref:protein dpy-30 homolog n=1 Tax=Teleopsis dalmanni TaxID=139649 RepID=UPI0018CF071B|nr:protein dpy-30 homolog [Teleopsis dalmanni]XP_037959991.1 protein dpy-30 homolog [Teleopsis dalmanni]